MGAKSTKKKGPKGKKARAKAKLEQVWGEHVDEEARRASQFRKGKSRVGGALENNTAKQHHNNKKEKEVDPLSRNRRGLKSSFESFLERKDNLYQTEQEQKQPQQQHQRYAHQKKNKRYNSRNDGSSDDDDDDSGSEDEEIGGVDNNNGGSLSNLLKRINGPKKKVAAESDDGSINGSDDDDSDDDTESVNSTSSSSHQSHSDNNSDDDNMDMDEEAILNLPKGAAEDPYEAHFSQQPLPQLDSTESTNLVPHLGKSSKVNTSSLLSSSMQVHLSGPILDSWETLTGSKLPDKTKSKQMWRAFAGWPQQHTRQVLSRNWNTVNRSALKRNKQRESSENENDIRLSSLQQVIYPAMSRYADVLISMESRQVSIYPSFLCCWTFTSYLSQTSQTNLSHI